ncbi:MAG TPA: FAD-dependent oxidoreductase, partial [Hyphomicrobiaceae bacterium]|nr:FAD-dependent oxidoreductase [Hyphomicrobiaceae bacterium]
VEDEEISAFARKAFEKQGMAIRTGTSVERLEPGIASVRARLKRKDGAAEDLTFDRVILAVGITGNVENLGLESLGVRIEKGHIDIDQWCRTNVPGVYAIGDVIGGKMLAHKAEEEGIAAVELMAGQAGHVNYEAIPAIVYTWPEVAAVGRTEEQLTADGVAYRVGKFPFTANSRARCNADADGLVKLLADA